MTETTQQPDVSVIIVTLADDPEDVASYRILREQVADSELEVEFVFRDDPGICTARNAGISAARADKLVFVDDDAHPGEEYLKRMAAALDEYPIVAGRIERPDEGYYAELADAPDPAEGDVIVGCNMAFRREVFERVGGFDEHIEWGYDETELLDRALPHFELRYEPDAVVEHEYAHSTMDYWRKMWRLGPADVYYARVTEGSGSGGAVGLRAVIGTLFHPSKYLAPSVRGTVIKSVGRLLRNVSIAWALLTETVPDPDGDRRERLS